MADPTNVDFMDLIRLYMIDKGVTFGNGFRDIYIDTIQQVPYINIFQTSRIDANNYLTKDFRLVMDWVENQERYIVDEIDDKVDDIIQRLEYNGKFLLGNMTDLDSGNADVDVYLSYFKFDRALGTVKVLSELDNGLIHINSEFLCQRLSYVPPRDVR